MPTSADHNSSSKVHYAALFAGRCRTDIPFNIRVGGVVSVQDAVDKTIQNLLFRQSRQNFDQNVVASNESAYKDSLWSSIRSMPRVTLTINRKRLKVKVTVDRKGRAVTGETTSTRSTSAIIRPSTFRHRLHNLLLVARCSHPLLRNAVACVLSEGYDPSTTGWIHMHIYWCVDREPQINSCESAEMFFRHVSRYVDTAEHRERVRRIGADMVARGRLQVTPVTNDVINKPPNRADLTKPVTKAGSEHLDVSFVQADHVKSRNYDPELNLRMPLVVDQHSTSLTTRDSNQMVTSPPLLVAVEDGSRQVNHDISSAQFTADGLDLNDADFIALRTRIARLSLMAAGDATYPMVAPLPRLSSNPNETLDSLQSTTSPYSEQTADASGVGRAGGPAWNVPPPIASLSDELKHRLVSGAPILLPPKDYDTVNRHRGNIVGIEARRCHQESIIGRPTVASSLF